jgi:hypothetical protein
MFMCRGCFYPLDGIGATRSRKAAVKQLPHELSAKGAAGFEGIDLYFSKANPRVGWRHARATAPPQIRETCSRRMATVRGRPWRATTLTNSSGEKGGFCSRARISLIAASAIGSASISA